MLNFPFLLQLPQIGCIIWGSRTTVRQFGAQCKDDRKEFAETAPPSGTVHQCTATASSTVLDATGPCLLPELKKNSGKTHSSILTGAEYWVPAGLGLRRQSKELSRLHLELNWREPLFQPRYFQEREESAILSEDTFVGMEHMLTCRLIG